MTKWLIIGAVVLVVMYLVGKATIKGTVGASTNQGIAPRPDAGAAMAGMTIPGIASLNKTPRPGW